MERFIERHDQRIIGVLSGFDRILFRGTIRALSYLDGMDKYLNVHGVLYKHFGGFVQRISDRIKEHAAEYAEAHGRPFRYLTSSSISKEDCARSIMEQDSIQQGLVCVLSCVESCQTYELHKDPKGKRLELAHARRKCLFLYFYFVDREFGLMHVRLQTWLPMTIQVCLNGREYLAGRLDKAGIGYNKQGNCFTHIDDLAKAQQMIDDLHKRNWVQFLNALARRFNPWLKLKSQLKFPAYYWTMRESEYATDVMFANEASLNAIYPALVNHAVQHFGCRDVMRFMGRRFHRDFNGEVTSDVKHRVEGVRIKHWVDENSIKMYDKAGSVLRIETTINNPRRFNVRRKATRGGEVVVAWFPMRKSVADVARRVEICHAANERYLEALAVVGESSPAHKILDPVSRRIFRQGRPYRGLRPIEPDEVRMFSVLQEGTFLLQGFRNKDLRSRLFPHVNRNDKERKRAAGRITRLLRLLRAHGLIRKVSGTFYYRITQKGQKLMTTALKLRDTELLELSA
ncbi:hypothetical protein Mal15_48190 [Stieleria maiorica]|uniref:Uncharacterized protein n=1 Tax=Stieleria maiorica TaxID=2795974 RepID=A0A5B9ML78_9BACT|nr:hypothetical protein [Stieleria maiorica]QEF97649.1 hypothetical protein Mal15_16900 [Stieleria maiorica]QEF97862.1 hypothetical protein Mal15_19080 [Stieleria maiorica]QEF97913.1 hypothetical protein Mal15_19590 [Stieleria maiorica]QEG00747.1 hypothetical protein Mal15_48190 [Stieleria maiorica]